MKLCSVVYKYINNTKLYIENYRHTKTFQIQLIRGEIIVSCLNQFTLPVPEKPMSTLVKTNIKPLSACFTIEEFPIVLTFFLTRLEVPCAKRGGEWVRKQAPVTCLNFGLLSKASLTYIYYEFFAGFKVINISSSLNEMIFETVNIFNVFYT